MEIVEADSAGGGAPPVAAEPHHPISRNQFTPHWISGSYVVRDDPHWPRSDYNQLPSGNVIIEERHHWNVVVRLPTWPDDQIECLKRAWCEVMKLHLGAWPFTRQFHMEVLSQQGAWVRLQAYEYVNSSNIWGRLLCVVFDEEPLLESMHPVHGWGYVWPPAEDAVREVEDLAAGGVLALEM